MRAVFDTNVYIAALVTEGVCSKLLTRARKREFTLISCPYILKELEKVLIGKFSVTRRELKGALDLIYEAIEVIVAPDQKVTGIYYDADDDNVLSCILAARAGYLITGDTELLGLREFSGTKIISPREFELLFED